MMSCVFAGEMPVPEEHYGKGVPGVLNLTIRLRISWRLECLGAFAIFPTNQYFVQLLSRIK